MTGFGSVCLLFVFVLTLFATLAGFGGGWSGRPRFARAAEHAILAAWVTCSLAMGAVLVLLLRDDFTVQYVWGHSNRDLPLFYKVTSLWAGQEGSLLLWEWVILCYGAASVLVNWRRNRVLMPYVVGVIASSACFFSLLNNFVANPFAEFALVHPDGAIHPLPAGAALAETLPGLRDGRGLNPLLQHPAMAIHPPVLYFGYIGFVVPFAFCVAALLSRQLGNAWILTSRRWTLITWSLLGSGILLGGRWAYVELGWGGYWAWDPVENASLMPWLVGTAFLHSVMIQEKRGMLKIWNVVLVLMTYTLSIFGTFTTRSGIISSVHAFAQSSIGGWFVGYIVILVMATTCLLVWRLKDLRTENRFESLVSRESAFLYNNVVLLAAWFAVFAGTVFPIVSEAVTGEKIVVGAPFFNRIMTPLGLLVLFLTGVGPLIPWRKCSLGSLWRNLALPAGVGVAAVLALLGAGVRHGYALLSLGLCAFVLTTIVTEFYRGGRARARSIQVSFPAGLVDLVRRNKRRYGGYLVHFALVVLFVGFTGKAFDTETKVAVRPGDVVQLRGYDLKVEEIVEDDTSNPNYVASRMVVRLSRGGRDLATLVPEARFYLASEQPATEVARWGSLREDVYAVFIRAGDASPPQMQVFVNPLVRFVWLGGIVLALAGLMVLIPNYRRPAERPRPLRDGIRAEEQVHA